MPRISTIQTNFTGGEWSPRLSGRIDVDRYNASAKRMPNCFVRVQGGAARRFGTRYIQAVKNPADRTVLIPFIYSSTEAYMLEFGDEYVRFYKNGEPILDGGLPFEIESPYTVDQVGSIDYVQDGNVMYLAHREVPIFSLNRYGDLSWKLDVAPFSAEPFFEQGRYGDSHLTIPPGLLVVASGAPGTFEPADVGRAIIYKSGRAVILSYIDSSSVNIEVKSEFPVGVLPFSEWLIDISPIATLTPDYSDPVGAIATLTLDIGGWRGNQVGQWVRVNGGLLLITEFVDAQTVKARIVKELTATVPAPPLSWTLERTQWDPRNGYPSTLTMYQQRLFAAGSKEFPTTIWASRTGEPLDFTIGIADDDAFSYRVSSDENDEIVHLSSDREIAVLTFGSEFTFTGGVEKPLTPTSIQLRPQSSYGSRPARPLQIGTETVYVQRGGYKVRAMGYRFESDRYVSSDITVFADHLLRAKAKQMAYLQEPFQILAVLRDDGVLLFGTYDREQGVIAFAPQYTDGAIESIAVLPGQEADELWAITRRVVDGETVRYVERFEPNWVPVVTEPIDENQFPPAEPLQNYGYTVDCGKEFLLDPPGTELTGLDHLEGKTVSIIADGLRHADKTVTAGAVALDREASKVLAGLFYAAEIEMLTPELGTGTGTAQGNSMRLFETTIFFNNTAGCRVNGQEIAFQSFGSELLDQPPKLFTGTHRMENLGADRGIAPLTLSQPYALPFEVSAVVRKLSVND